MTTNYIIRHVTSGLVLEPDSEGVILRRRSNSFLQLWKVETTVDGYNALINHDLWRAMEALENGQVKLRTKNGKRSQEWLINSDGTIENAEFNLVLNIEKGEQPLGGRLICEEKGRKGQCFAVEAFKMEEHEYNRLIFY